MMSARRFAIGLVVGLLAADVLLIVSGRRLLISERRIHAGENVEVQGYGNMKNTQDSLACTYFTGRSTVVRMFWYSANNMFGRDECPVILGPND
jgi:hypothetical protein